MPSANVGMVLAMTATFTLPRALLLVPISALGLAGCNNWEDDMEQGAVAHSRAAMEAPAAPRIDYERAQQRIVTGACTRAYAAQGAQAQQRCTETWRTFLEDLVDEDERDDEEEAAQGVCLARGVICAAIEPCQRAADAFVQSNKRGLSVADIVLLQHMSQVCSARALCVEG